MATIKEAIEYSKVNPDSPFATELRKRIESGQMNGELESAGLNQYISAPTPQPKQSVVQKTVSDVKQRGENILNNTDKNISLPEKVLQNAGQVIGAGGDILGNVVGAGLKATGLDKPVQQAVEGIVNSAPVKSGMEMYEQLPQRAQDNINAVANIAGVATGLKGTQVVANTALKGAEATAKTVGKGITATKKIAGEVIPTTDRIVNHQVTRALELTQGDVKNISQSTGHEVGQFLAERNLIGGNKDETAKMIKSFYDENYSKVREEIGKVSKTYTQDNVPRFNQTLKQIQKQISGIAGLEADETIVKNLLKKETVELKDVQKVKELLDEHFSLYKVTGDVKEGVTKEGLSKLRTELKEFIEKEVKGTTGEDISALNNNVSTSRSIADAIEERSTRGLTTSNIKLGDLGIFGVGMSFGGPLGGAAAVVGKKILESSAVRLKVARYLDGVSDAKKAKIKKQMESGVVPKEIESIVEPKKNSFKAGTVPKTVSGKYDAKELSDYLKNSLLNDSKGKFDKPDRFKGEGYSYKEAKTGLAEDGLNHNNRIVIGKNDKGEPILIDGTHLLEAYRELGIKIPSKKIQFLKD